MRPSQILILNEHAKELLAKSCFQLVYSDQTYRAKSNEKTTPTYKWKNPLIKYAYLPRIVEPVKTLKWHPLLKTYSKANRYQNQL